MRKWRDAGYWRWLWRDRVSRGAKVFLATLAALLIATGGYASARSFAPEDDEAYIERVVTLIHKEQVPGSEVVTVRRTITTREPQKTKVVTVQRNGRTITVKTPVQTITGRTVTTKGKERIVKLRGSTVTVPGKTRTRTNTIMTPGSTVTTPARTETIERDGPSRTVTSERTVTNERTVTGPTTTTTVTNEVTVTSPPKTVTETETVTTPPITVTLPGPPGP